MHNPHLFPTEPYLQLQGNEVGYMFIRKSARQRDV